MPFLILISYGLLLGILTPITQELTQLYNNKVVDELKADGELANRFVLDYFSREGRYPDSLSQAINTSDLPGTEIDPRINYFIARDVTDDSWTFDRYLIVAQGVFNDQPVNTVLAENSCSDGETDNELLSAKSYCPPSSYIYSAYGQSNNKAADRLNAERLNILETLRKLTMIYSALGEFPKISSRSGEFQQETIETLQEFVGNNETQSECNSGTSYENIQLECSDIFSINFKSAVYYHYISENNVGLFVVTDLKRSNGENIIIGHELKG